MIKSSPPAPAGLMSATSESVTFWRLKKRLQEASASLLTPVLSCGKIGVIYLFWVLLLFKSLTLCSYSQLTRIKPSKAKISTRTQAPMQKPNIWYNTTLQKRRRFLVLNTPVFTIARRIWWSILRREGGRFWCTINTCKGDLYVYIHPVSSISKTDPNKNKPQRVNQKSVQ